MTHVPLSSPDTYEMPSNETKKQPKIIDCLFRFSSVGFFFSFSFFLFFQFCVRRSLLLSFYVMQCKQDCFVNEDVGG